MARLWEGAGLSLWIIGRQTILHELTTKETRGRFMSTLGGVARLSAVVGPLVGGYLAHYFNNLRWSFWCQAGLNVINALLLLGIILWMNHRQRKGSTNMKYVATATSEQEAEETEESLSFFSDDSISGMKSDGNAENHPRAVTAPIADEPSTGMSWRELLSRYGWILMTLAGFCFCMAVVRESRHLLFPLKAMESGYDVHQIGVMTSITFLADSLMFPVAGYLMDYHGRKYSGISANIVMGLSLAAVPVLTRLYPTSLVALTVASAGCGVGNGLSSGLLKSLSGDVSPLQGQDRAKFLPFQWDIGQSLFGDHGI